MANTTTFKVKLSAESLADLLISNDRYFLMRVYLPTFDNETRRLFLKLIELDEKELKNLIAHEEFSYGIYEDLEAMELSEDVG